MNIHDFHAGICNHIRHEIFDTITAVVRSNEGCNVRFVEVGANDGSSGHDPVFPYVKVHNWEGVLVEPVPYLFKRLKENYPTDSKVQFVQACCGSEEGIFPFYEVDESAEAISPVAPFLSSFDRSVIMNHACFVPDMEKYINTIPIQTKRVDTIVKESGIGNIHVLVTDTEGHDDKVLSGYNFDNHRPMAVYMEHKHIRFDALRNIVSQMEGYNYKPIWMFEDILFVNNYLFSIPLVKNIFSMMEAMYRV